MLTRKQKDPELLPGANPEEDCQPTVPPVVEGVVEAEDEDDAHEHLVTWTALPDDGTTAVSPFAQWLPQRARWAHFLERISLWMERPFNLIAGTTQLNPLYHTGMIATFLLIIVGLTGVYIFMFFQYGFEASYNSVAARIEAPFITRVMRAVHRYASGALVITTLLHAYRTLFLERFRGPRWLAWVTGIALTVIIWLGGVTGYWLVWDTRAQLINDEFIRFLDSFSTWGAQFAAWIGHAEETGNSWPLLLALLVVHVLLFLIAAGVFVPHILRLKRAQFLPEVHWAVSIGVILLIISALFPLGMLPPADPARAPALARCDPIFLFYLPLSGSSADGWLWGGLLLVTAVSLALPWLPRARRRSAALPLPPPVNIIKERCTGCTKCALDCPFGAIEMVERHDGKRHKFIAIEDPALCVSCGICVGSCDGVAVTLGDTPPELMWTTVAARLALAKATAPEGGVRLVFTCERHAAHGARPYLSGGQQAIDDVAVAVVALPCVGAAPPDLITRALDAGAAGVQVVGCPPFDCANREGNLWTEQRLTRRRVPRLQRAYAQAPVTAVWTTPDQFAAALHTAPVMRTVADGEPPQPDYQASRRMFPALKWRNYLGAFALLALVMVAQVFLTDLPFRPAAANAAHVRVIVADPAAPFDRPGAAPLPAEPVQLELIADGQMIWSEPFAPDALFEANRQPFYRAVTLTPGVHHLRLAYAGAAAPVLFDDEVDLAAGEILRIQFQPDFRADCRGPACLQN